MCSELAIPEMKQDEGCLIFEKSNKPAILFSEMEKGFNEYKKKYPYVQCVKNGKNVRVFFRDELRYQMFLKELKEKEIDSQTFFEDDGRMGILLGYPPSAVKAFTNNQSSQFFQIVYNGWVVYTPPEMVIPNLVWLRVKYPLGEGVQTGSYVMNHTGSKWVEVIENNFYILEELEEMHGQYIGINSAV